MPVRMPVLACELAPQGELFARVRARIGRAALRGHTLDGAPCTHAVLVGLRAGTWGGEREVGKALEQLHLDHERPLLATCPRWRATLPAALRSWDDALVH